MKKREMKLLLEERFERIALLETRIDTLDQLVEGYRARETSIFNTLSAAKENAAKALEQAETEGAKILAGAEAVRADAEKIRNAAREEAESLLAQAIMTANTLKEEAERKGNELTADIRADSQRMLRDAEIIKREYEEMVESFNAMLEQNASELEVTAARFAEFVKKRKIDRSESRLDGDAFYKSVGEMNEEGLPDASENPTILMQNIYRIQNRPLPEDRHDTQLTTSAAKPEATRPEETAELKSVYSMEVGAPENETAGTEEPFSQAAWASDEQKSESEPQAEFTRAFDPAFERSDYTIHQDECAVTQEDAKSAFDALVTEPDAAAAVAIPLGSAIVAAGMGEKPMAETVSAVDAYFDAVFEPSGKTAQDEVPQAMQQGPEGAAMPAEEPVRAAAEPMLPEPYSEQAWAQSASYSEPQSEGTLFTEVNDIAQEAAELPTADTSFAQPAATTEAAAMPEPYSEQAWAQSSAFSEMEPQSEGTLFTEVNEIAQEAAQMPAPATQTAVPAAKSVSPQDMVNALDDYFEQIDVSAPTLPQTPATRPATAPDAYSERSWAQTDMASNLEPQAEGTLFGDVNAMLPDFVPASMSAAGQFVPTAFGVYPMNRPVTASEAEYAFDAYLNKLDKGEPAATTEPAPYSEQAWAQSDHASDHEPQAEGALFADVNAYEPVFTPAAGAPVAPLRTAESAPAGGTVTANDAVNVFDDYLAQMEQAEPFAPTVPETPATEPASAPEPYSAQAWAYTPNVSEYEPQAEGESIISVYDPDKKEDQQAYEPISYSEPAVSAEPEEEEEPEPAPAPRRYNEYGEIREWEPEPEPDMSDVPTVSRYMGQSGSSDDISLDDLLDEIIKAGE